MSQLISRGAISTIKYTNAILRNITHMGNPPYIILRTDGKNTPDFSRLSCFKDLVLDLARQADAEIINDIAIIMTKPGQENILHAEDNRLILILENEASFTNEDSRYTPQTGDLIWTNQEIVINNNSTNLSIVLVIDIKEFLL